MPEPSCRLSLRVTPRSSRPRVVWDGAKLNVWVSAPPAEGQANRASIRLIADRIRVAPSAIEILRGGHGREKLIEITGLELDQVIPRLVE